MNKANGIIWPQENLASAIEIVEDDLRYISRTGQYPVVVLLRGYDLLEMIGSGTYAAVKDRDFLEQALRRWKAAFAECGEKVERLLDPEEIGKKVEAYKAPAQRVYRNAAADFQVAEQLWKAAVHAYECRQSGNWFSRWKSLRQVRKMAGFPLEKNRIGNFVTRTSELKEEARRRMRQAELEVFAHNVEYKCFPQLYARINEALERLDINDEL